VPRTCEKERTAATEAIRFVAEACDFPLLSSSRDTDVLQHDLAASAVPIPLSQAVGPHQTSRAGTPSHRICRPLPWTQFIRSKLILNLSGRGFQYLMIDHYFMEGLAMEFKDIVTLYFERSNALQTYWSFYTTMALALLAYFGGMKPSPRKFLIAIVLSLSFISFAVVNLDALKAVTEARILCKKLLCSGKLDHSPSPEVQRQIQQMITPWPFATVVVMHISGDLFTLGSIWFLVLLKSERRTHRASAKLIHKTDS
jgi:hypothetical protein